MIILPRQARDKQMVNSKKRRTFFQVFSGMSYAAFLKERVLTPCGMTDTGFDVPLEKRHR
jgi:hypothetical protein